MLYYYFDFKVLFRLLVNPSEFSSSLQWNFCCCFIQLHVLYGFINRRCLYPPWLIRFTWRGSWQWNQTRAILKTIIQSFKCHHKSGDWWGNDGTVTLPCTGKPILGFVSWFFFNLKNHFVSGGEYPCVCKLSRLTLNVWLHVFTKIRYTILTLISIFLTKYQTIRFSQRNYYNIWNANISGKKVK